MTPSGNPDDEHKEDLPEEELADRTTSDRTVSDADDEGASKTQVFSRDTERAAKPAPGIADMTMTDFSRSTQGGEPQAGAADADDPEDEEEGADRTRVQPGPGRPAPEAAPAPPPFPWAQEIPGGGPQAAGPPAGALAAGPPPVAPAPVDEPWRTPGKAKKGVNKKILFGVLGGVAAAALVAGGVVVVLGMGGDDETEAGGARFAGALFPGDPAARSDGRDQELTGVAASGSTVVAVGGEADPGNYRGVFLVSADGGRTFQTAKVEGADGGEPGATEVPRLVAGGQGGWVAIGTRPGGGVVWLSQDGKTWQRQPDAAGDVFGPGNRVTRLIRTEQGYLALGEHSRKGDFSDSVPATWLSSDGKRWDAQTGSQVGFPIRGKVVLEEAAAGQGVVLMESAHTPKPGKASFRRAWRSTDGGRTWSPAKIPAPKGTRGLHVGGGQAGLVAVREVKSGKSTYGQVYTSADATSWKTGGKLESAGYQEVQQLIGGESGYTGIVRGKNGMSVSRSADGKSWSDAGTLPAASGRTMLGAAASGGQTVLVGRDPGNGDLNALLAVRDQGGKEVPVDPFKIPGAFRKDQAVAAVAAKGAQAAAVGSTGGDAAIWTSADGAAWQRARFSGGISRPGLQRLTSVANGGAGWLAVGDNGGAPRSPLVLTSADGNVWKPVDNDPVFAQKGSQALGTYAAASGPAGYVVVGDDGASGAIWFSPDLKTWQRGGGVGRNDLTALPKGNRWVRSAAGGEFGFVAVGGALDPKQGGARRPAVWTSADGKKWQLQQIELPSGLTQGSLSHVAAKGSVLVAAGDAVGTSGLVTLGYVSTDGGKTWRETKLPAPDAEGLVRITAVTATTKGFTVAGTSGGGTADVVSWTSADGSTFEAQAPGGEVLSAAGRQEITGLAPYKDGVLGVGRTVASSGEQPVLWSRPDS
ncbi:exo-alpha-sialidase [Actinomadura darangshiensis]|uniref:Exo-alpha-sialidase n=1 Tax=Actinomadura darangshiensis TaxID=705336 RepID=A0A4R5A898_9ACTN|nr:sialidase family protein [Actinomadura darangshiensis]TDD68428.1 exo-alpha-sialidase [Actinomadura darangshiensis]